MAPLLTLLGHLLILQFVNAQDANDNCFINDVEWGIHGRHDFAANCMGFTCVYGKWVTTGRYKPTCHVCRLANDPHITTFDGAKYDWHGDCTYVIAQEEDTQGEIVSYVYNKFTKCGRASCVDTVHFKPRVGPIITVLKRINYSPNNTQVVIDGYSQSITTSGRDMQVLEGGLGTRHREYPVLAYWLDGCLHIIAVDTQDFLVKVCRWFIKVYAPREKFSERNVSGMCGSPDNGPANDDLKLRNGTVVRNPNGWGWRGVVDSVFAYDWQVSTGSCGNTSGRRRRSTSHEVDKEPCKASEAQKSEYTSVCQDTIGNDPSISEDMRKDFIDGCAFDRCIITQTGADDDTVKEWLNEWSKVAQHEVFEQENQEDITDEDYEYIDYLSDYYDSLITDSPSQPGNKVTTTPAPELTCPISSVIEAGDKQFAFFTCPKSYLEAREFCKLYGWALATPDEQFEQFNERMPDNGEYWLDVQPDASSISPMIWYWQTFPKKNQTTKTQWKVGHYNSATINSGTNCASLYQNDGLLAFKCEQEWFFVCESFHFFNVQHSEVRRDDIHVQRRVAPQRNL